MWNFILLFKDFIVSLLGLLNGVAFDIGGITATYLELLIGFIALSIIISAFWKGVRG